MRFPLEQAHDRASAERLEAALEVAYPRTVWLVADFDDAVTLPCEHDGLRQFCVDALTFDGSRHVMVTVPFTLLVDEEAFPFVVVALGRELQRRLRALVREGSWACMPAG